MELLKEEEEEILERKSLVEEEKSEVESELIELKEKLKERQNSLDRKTLQESELDTKMAQINDALDAKAKKSQAINQEIVDRHGELAKLKSDINLFPTEIHAFVTQGARNIARYTFLALLPIMVIAYVACYLFYNAADFAISYSSISSDNIWAILIARLPFVMVSLGIISASYKITRIFIDELIKINRQRLNLSKVSIIAKDVSESSEHGLDINDEQRYELRTKLKMDLLRSHLKGYVEDEYSYTASSNAPRGSGDISNDVKDREIEA